MKRRSDIIERVKVYIVNASFLQKEDIDNDTLIFENSLLDSMGFLFLIDFLKEEFEIEVEDEDLVDDNFKSINNISEYILNKLKVEIIKSEQVI